MTTTLQIEIPRQLYGAVELKRITGRNALKGLGISSALLFIFLSIFLIIHTDSIIIQKRYVGNGGTFEWQPKPPITTNYPQLPNIPANSNRISSDYRAGNPVPIPDALIDVELNDFASIQYLSSSLPEAGDYNSAGFQNEAPYSGRGEVTQAEPETPSSDIFIAVEYEPVIDMEALRSHIVYPEIARKAGIEGKVILRILVQKDGIIRTDKIIVEYSDSQLLNQSAIQAVKDYGKAIPAIQNGKNISVWVSIPIIFRMR